MSARPCCRILLFVSNKRPQCRHTSFTRHTFRNEKKEIGATGYLLGAIPLVAFCLGTWQVQRRKWKLGLIRELEHKTALPPVPLPTSLEEVAELEFRKVLVRGHFVHSKEMYIRPRSLVTPGKEQGGGSLISSPRVGSWVVTPFALADREGTILVNRGWIPKGTEGRPRRLEPQTEEELDLVGIVRLTEKRLPLGSKHLTSDDVCWSRRDVERMAEVAGCLPVFVDAVAESNPQGGPVGGQTRVTLRNEHMSYIITWYSLSAATALLWYTKFMKRAL